MSQVATSNMIYPSGYETSKTRIAIGNLALVSGDRGIAIGGVSSNSQYSTNASTNSIAIGHAAKADGAVSVGQFAGNGASITFNAESNLFLGSSAGYRTTPYTISGAVCLGGHTQVSRDNEVSVGNPNATGAQPLTRFVSNVTDPTLAQDAATKNYVDNAISSISIATITNEDWSSLWQQTTIQRTA